MMVMIMIITANMMGRIHQRSLLVLAVEFLINSQPIGYGLKLSAEKNLIRGLLADYQQVTEYGRPVLNITDPVNVRFGLGLIQMELDEREKALSLSLWSKYVWEDHYLQWVPGEHEGIKSIKLPSHLIWIPDIMLYNTAETEISARDTLATIYFNGTVVWVPHQKLKSSCSIDVTNFPFDRQQCHMWFGSWTYTTSDINLTMAFQAGLDLSTFHADFKDTSQWAITESRAERRVLPVEDRDPNFSVLTYTLGLKRNLVFASYILTLPCVFLACLTLVVFWLPPDRPDRTALAMSIFASFLLLLLILVEAAPPTANSVPSLGIYYCFNMVIIMMAVFLSSLVVNVCQFGDTGRPVPNWLRKLTMEGPMRYICMCNGLLPMGGSFYNDWSTFSSIPPPSGSYKEFDREGISDLDGDHRFSCFGGSDVQGSSHGGSLSHEAIPLHPQRSERPLFHTGLSPDSDQEALGTVDSCYTKDNNGFLDVDLALITRQDSGRSGLHGKLARGSSATMLTTADDNENVFPTPTSTICGSGGGRICPTSLSPRHQHNGGCANSGNNNTTRISTIFPPQGAVDGSIITTNTGSHLRNHKMATADTVGDSFSTSCNFRTRAHTIGASESISTTSGTPWKDSSTTTTKTTTTNQRADEGSSSTSGVSHSDMAELLATLTAMRSSVSQLSTYFYARAREERSWRSVRKQWKNVAFVLDRVFFLLYVCLIILSVAILFPRPDGK